MLLQAYSSWPTYPQLYAGSDLVGGCDLVLELQSTGDLKSVIDEALASPPPDQTNGHASLQDRLKQLTTASEIVLFMKVCSLWIPKPCCHPSDVSAGMTAVCR